MNEKLKLYFGFKSAEYADGILTVVTKAGTPISKPIPLASDIFEFCKTIENK